MMLNITLLGLGLVWSSQNVKPRDIGYQIDKLTKRCAGSRMKPIVEMDEVLCHTGRDSVVDDPALQSSV